MMVRNSPISATPIAQPADFKRQCQLGTVNALRAATFGRKKSLRIELYLSGGKNEQAESDTDGQ